MEWINSVIHDDYSWLNDGLVQFNLTVVAVALGIIAYFSRNGKRLKKSALGGIIAFAAAGILLASISSYVSAGWFEYGEVYLGVDRTLSHTGTCDEGENSDRMTSNGGLVGNLYRSDDKRFSWNGKLTHHSCISNGDRFIYDAAGFEFRFRGWDKRP